MRPIRSTPKAMQRASELRRSPTPAELKLWARIRRSQLDGVRFRRQHAIGEYIVDFCAPREKLIIEVDGRQHVEQRDYDNERTRFLAAEGYRVLRVWNDDVEKDIDGVIVRIQDALRSIGEA